MFRDNIDLDWMKLHLYAHRELFVLEGGYKKCRTPTPGTRLQFQTLVCDQVKESSLVKVGETVILGPEQDGQNLVHV